MLSRWLRKRQDHPTPGEAPDESSDVTEVAFRDRIGRLDPAASVVEFGTRRAKEAIPTYSHCLCPQIARRNYLLVDILPGLDVDEIADIHALPLAWGDRFAIAVFEHLERPWIAAREVARVLAPAGFCYIATHQTYPLHGHPSDFFRFSKEALSLLFVDAGLSVGGISYRHRTQIILPEAMMNARDSQRWNRMYPSYVTVELLAEKTA